MALFALKQAVPKGLPKDLGADIRTIITDQCALFAQPEEDFRVDPLVGEGDRVQQGAPVLRSRRQPELVLTAPVAGEVAALSLGPGRRLSHMLFFHAPEAGRFRHDPSAARGGEDAVATRALLLAAGMWPLVRSRPFGSIPAPLAEPAAIFVMAADTRPDAVSPSVALRGRDDDFLRGLRAISRLSGGVVYLCHDNSLDVSALSGEVKGLRTLKVATKHPHGLAGHQIARHHPATLDRIVWDIRAGDVANMGSLLETGFVPETRLVSIGGSALRESRLVHCQPGADLRALTFDIVRPGALHLLSGSGLDGVAGRWLGRWHHQVTGLSGGAPEKPRHWFSAALRHASRPLPIIPTEALEQAFGHAFPAVPLVRALASNDAETALRLGALSLLEEDLALADYVTAASPRLSAMLRSMLDHVASEAGE